MELTQRKKRILAAVVDEYIATAEPVGSKYIAEQSGLGCSSATVRNELAELVNMGYLEQPHTSAGRVPTSKGYRMYVNELMDRHRMSLMESEELCERLNQRLAVLDNTINELSHLVSQFTDYPALVLTSKSNVTVKRYDIIYVDANTIIIVAMLSNNTVRNKLVSLPISVDEGLVGRISKVFNAMFTGLGENEITPSLVNAAERASGDTVGLTSVIASFAIQILSEETVPSSFMTGENRLLSQPEYQDPAKAHQLMNYLQGGRNILSEHEYASTDGIKVLIGPENVADELKDSSVIVASYDAGDGTKGLIGVIGPTRMDYSLIAEKLGFLADVLSKKLGSGSKPVTGMHNKLILKGDDSDK